MLIINDVDEGFALKNVWEKFSLNRSKRLTTMMVTLTHTHTHKIKQTFLFSQIKRIALNSLTHPRSWDALFTPRLFNQSSLFLLSSRTKRPRYRKRLESGPALRKPENTKGRRKMEIFAACAPEQLRNAQDLGTAVTAKERFG